MKKLIALVLSLMLTLTAVAAVAEESPAAPSKTLVVYYSATGTTERIASMAGRDAFFLRHG